MSRRHRRPFRPPPIRLIPEAMPRVFDRPDAETDEQLPLSEFPPSVLGDGVLIAPGYQRLYQLGECTVIVTREYRDRWHLSIAHPRRNPTWSEISQARNRVLPTDIWVAMYLPPPGRYRNVHRFCFHFIQCDPLPDEMQRYL